MYDFLLTVLLILSVIIVISILMQPQKNPSSNVFDSNSSEALFERTKARGFEAFMQKVTAVLGVIFFVLALALVYISSN